MPARAGEGPGWTCSSASASSRWSALKPHRTCTQAHAHTHACTRTHTLPRMHGTAQEEFLNNPAKRQANLVLLRSLGVFFGGWRWQWGGIYGGLAGRGGGGMRGGLAGCGGLMVAAAPAASSQQPFERRMGTHGHNPRASHPGWDSGHAGSRRARPWDSARRAQAGGRGALAHFGTSACTHATHAHTLTAASCTSQPRCQTRCLPPGCSQALLSLASACARSQMRATQPGADAPAAAAAPHSFAAFVCAT